MSIAKRVKRYLVLCSLVLGSLCVAMLLAEGAVRVFFPHARDHVIPAGLFAIDDDLGWRLTPETRREHRTRYFDVVYATNSLGYRDKPRNVSKDPKTRRILLYGDSLLFGWGIPEEKRVSNLIEDQRPNLEVWNVAVPGYGLDQEILAYEKEGESLHADEVIFCLSSSTLARTHTGFIFGKYKPSFEMDRDGNLKLVPVPKGKNSAHRWLYQILSPFYLPYFAELELTTLKTAFDSPGYSVRAETIGDFEKKILIRAQSIARTRNQRTAVLTNLPPAARKDLRDFCDQNGIGYLEIVLDGYQENDITFGPYDRHWNLGAQPLVAQRLLSQMESQPPDFWRKNR